MKFGLHLASVPSMVLIRFGIVIESMELEVPGPEPSLNARGTLAKPSSIWFRNNCLP